MERVSIVVINWNSLADTLECLRSLEEVRAPGVEVIVIDNASRNREAEQIQAAFPAVQVHACAENTGYTGGNNRGIEIALRSDAEIIVCLNNDTVVPPDFLRPLLEALRTRPDIGLATPAILAYDRRDQLVGLGGALRPHFAGGYALIEWKSAEPFEVDLVEGCSLVMRRAVAEAIGGFDERFFAYLEDIDLCLRARTHGFGCLAVPASRIFHKITRKHSGASSPASVFYGSRNCWMLVRRHGDRRSRLLFPFVRGWSGLHAWGWSLHQQLHLSDPEERRLERERCVAEWLGTVAGLFGFSGDRRKGNWMAIERVLQPVFRALLFVSRPLAFATVFLRRAKRRVSGRDVPR